MTDEFTNYLRQVMSTENGRQFIYELLTITGVHSHTAAPMETIYANYFAGKRCVGETLTNALYDMRNENGADGYFYFALMMREARLREDMAERKAKAQREDSLEF